MPKPAPGHRWPLHDRQPPVFVPPRQPTQDRQKVVDLMSAGKDLQTAVAEINTEENFKNWCRELKEELEKACE